MAQLKVSELDFDNIKQNLKTYLKSQTEFSDYNFEGSGLNVILDLLAYNTHYNGILAHMLANENFIDTAVKRESVVSIAKTLGYTPRSRRGAISKLNLSIEPPESFTNTTLEISRDTPFSTTVEGTAYTFYPTQTTTVNATTAGGVGPYYLYGTCILPSTATDEQGFYYPVYLTETAAVSADTGGTGATTYTFKEYSGINFYMPNSSINAHKETLGTVTTNYGGVTVESGLAYGRYTGQTSDSPVKTQFNYNLLEVKEGTRVQNKFIVETANLQGPFVLPNIAADTDTLRVRVQNSASDLTVITYTKSDKLLDIQADTKTYWCEEGADGLFQIRFGDNIVGKQLVTDNIVIIDYIVSNASDANFAKTFTLASAITASGESIQLDTAIAAYGGASKEGVDEIRFNAPRFNTTKERAVTSSDYEALILQSNNNIQSVSVWGGEKNDPPIYGKVFISLNPVIGSIITQADKDNIKTSIIDPKTPVAIIPEFVDPDFVYIGLDISVAYNPKLTTLSKGEIENAVNLSVNSYFNTDLNKLNKSFYNTRLHDSIKQTTESIIAINITSRLQKRITPVLTIAKNYSIQFNQRLQPRELSSSYFNITSGGATYKVSLADVPASSVVPPLYSGTGTVNAIKTDGTIIEAVGTVDYDSGTITIPSMTVASLLDTETKLRINAVTQRDVRDITTQALVRTSDTSTAAVVAKPSRNVVLTLDDSVTNSIINTKVGLNISATPEVEEI
jgi:hypothetical protein